MAQRTMQHKEKEKYARGARQHHKRACNNDGVELPCLRGPGTEENVGAAFYEYLAVVHNVHHGTGYQPTFHLLAC